MRGAEPQSPTLMALVHASGAALSPPVDTRGLDKTEALSRIAAQAGWPAVFAAGRAARTLGWHPVVLALTACGEPVAVLERWLRLERFGHARNRAELLAAHQDGERRHLRLRHGAIDGQPVAAVDDLFIWGVLVGLLEAAGTRLERVSLSPDGGGSLLDDQPLDGWSTAELHLTGLVGRAPPPAWRDVDLGVSGQLRARLATDPVRAWTLDQAGRALGLSARSLQRALAGEGASFTSELQRARLGVARALLTDPRLSLGEIAFCAGFSDQAHLSRVCRRHFDVPPSELRALLRSTPKP